MNIERAKELGGLYKMGKFPIIDSNSEILVEQFLSLYSGGGKTYQTSLNRLFELLAKEMLPSLTTRII